MVEPAREELEELVRAARVDAEVCVPVSSKTFAETLHAESHDADLILLGFTPPDPDRAEAYHEQMTGMLNDMPSTLLIYSTGEVDLLA